MEEYSTLESAWIGTLCEYPIRDVEYGHGLVYIAEFHDGVEVGEGWCLLHSPESCARLTIETLQAEMLESALN